MREIKFRAWDKVEGEWVDIKHIRFESNGIWYVQSQDEFERDIDPPYFPERNELSLMQYTGIKDKNGVDIYEGDVIKGPFDFGPLGVKNRTTEVYFNHRGGYQWNYWMDLSEIEVIGNIYENPELLEDKR